MAGWVLALAQEGERPEGPLPLRPAPSAPRPQAVEPAARYNLSQPEHIDRRTISDLAAGAMDLAHLGLRDDGSDVWAARALKWTVSAWFGVACTHVVHEYGHMSSLSRCGCDTAVIGKVGAPLSEREDATVERLFVHGLWPAQSRALSLGEDDWADVQARFEGRPEAFNRFWLGVEAGGLNQEQALAARYAVRLREERLSYLDTTSYLWAASGTFFYPSNSEESDIADYIARLKVEGREVSASRLKALTGFRFVGGTGIASARGAMAGAFGTPGGFVEPLSTEPLEDLRVFWPEFESYLTLAGPTLKTSLPVRLGEWTFLPSYERSFAAGGVDHEGGARARAPFLDGILVLEGGLYVNDRGGVWQSGEAELRPIEWVSLLVGVEAGRGYTFRRDVFGAREEVLEGSEHSLLVGLRVTLAF
ncbi:MAG TPA: hypothetical protein VF950_25370 [Planctomycetota bacterium]